MGRSKKVAMVDRRICVACGCCEKVCRLASIQVIKGCYASVNEERCVGCGLCAKECPATAIILREREDESV